VQRAARQRVEVMKFKVVAERHIGHCCESQLPAVCMYMHKCMLSTMHVSAQLCIGTACMVHVAVDPPAATPASLSTAL
jgi:hypothetical protein